jgi:hypothetical protein
VSALVARSRGSVVRQAPRGALKERGDLARLRGVEPDLRRRAALGGDRLGLARAA